MKARYALSLPLFCLVFNLQGQNLLSVSEYDALKAAGQLPAHPVIVADQQHRQLKPHLGAMKGGGGCSCWIEPDGTYTLAMPPVDDLSSEVIALPFTFTLFGDAYTEIYINNNGNISFDAPYATFSSNAFPDSSFIMVAPFWADVDTRGEDGLGLNGGEVFYKVTSTAVFVNWVDVGYFSHQTDKHNTFQLIITDGTDPVIPGGNNVSFCYKDMQWTTGAASAGIDGFGGVPATVGANRGNGVDHAQVGRFAWDTDVYDGAYDDTNGISWLDSAHFYMNTIGAGIPPIFGSTFDCDTVIVQMDGGEAHSALSQRLSILPGGPGQQVSCVSVAPTLPNYVSLNIGFADHLVFPVVINTEGAVVGTHYITFTATNDQPVPLVSQYVLQVEVEASTTLSEIGLGSTELGISPMLANDRITVSWSMGQTLSTIELFSADGRLLRRVDPRAGTITYDMDLEGLAPGTYVVLGQVGGNVLSARFVKVGDR